MYSASPKQDSRSPSLTVDALAFFSCIPAIMIPASEDRGGTTCAAKMSHMYCHAFSAVPNTPLCIRTGTTGRSTFIIPWMSANFVFFSIGAYILPITTRSIFSVSSLEPTARKPAELSISLTVAA